MKFAGALAFVLLLAAGAPWLLDRAPFEHGSEVAGHVNQALAALQAGAWQEAEIAAEKAAALGGPSLYPLRDFLLGNAAYARGEQAAVQALGPEAEPFAFDLALRHVERAREEWQRAAMGRSDWTAACRNVERALRSLAKLNAQRAAAEQRRSERKKDERRRSDGASPDVAEEEAAPAVEAPAVDAAPDLVTRLLDRLAAKEREKRAVRRIVRQARSADVERDW